MRQEDLSRGNTLMGYSVAFCILTSPCLALLTSIRARFFSSKPPQKKKEQALKFLGWWFSCRSSSSLYRRTITKSFLQIVSWAFKSTYQKQLNQGCQIIILCLSGATTLKHGKANFCRVESVPLPHQIQRQSPISCHSQLCLKLQAGKPPVSKHAAISP